MVTTSQAKTTIKGFTVALTAVTITILSQVAIIYWDKIAIGIALSIAIVLMLLCAYGLGKIAERVEESWQN